MELVEILARELKKWPGDFPGLTQSAIDSEIYSVSDLSDPEESAPLPGNLYASRRHDEHENYPLVTRADWQAAKDKLEGKVVKKPNANKDGWVRHRGGKCPVEAGTMVNYRMRNGVSSRCSVKAELLSWSHEGESSDVMAWKLCPPSNQPANIEESSPVEPVAPIANPLKWRDRITEIDAESKAEAARHNAAMTALNAERAELVQKLASEGLAMIERKAEPMDDMSDPANWREGDVLECVNREWITLENFAIGSLYTLLRNDGEEDGDQHHWLKVKDGDGDYMGVPASEFKWHSRPTN